MAGISLKKNEILAVVDGFRNRTLPATQWTHEAHLITGLWFNYSYTPLEALCYMRSGIIIYNVTIGGENTPQRGYHETLTVFWNNVLAQHVASYRDEAIEDVCSKFFMSDGSSKDFPFLYYSKEKLFSLEARATWVEPDLRTMEKLLNDY